ncbi:putative malate--quinone oxidoreductase [Gordonia effusa NBRC 100432]|uniref:Probable malate:quinone oxidoreductase n=1 Tax=Gordonia effusa NBRC 100432 TaxID=1077974 RepID=H0R579_9ACTN|nr:malate dehydrogenase (quinone) [Gordonia effusa]GAB20230.1 putative malate--quinone oxidoreductase [Gordonia effusa NBRC 100432]
MTTRSASATYDVVLIGGGIMSTTLGAMLSTLAPDLRIVLLERADRLAQESSGSWNNAGTGHSGFCELNYMPDPADGEKALDVARQYRITRQWWSSLADRGLVDLETFVRSTPHMNLVFTPEDVSYLRQRHETLSASTLFDEMEYSEDPDTIRSWAPLSIQGRTDGPIAATRVAGGTDVDFGSLTHSLASIITENGGEVRTSAEVTKLRRSSGGWVIYGRNRHGDKGFELDARFVFVGAGGQALRLLQKANVAEVRGYGVLPVGAAFLRCTDPEVVGRHDAKVYGQAPTGAPPMSVPHLDKRFVGGELALMFGPYATFSTRLLRGGKLTDFFATVRWHNAVGLACAIAGNWRLVKYLLGQLLSSRTRRFAQLRAYYPTANPDQWELIGAGQRAQLIRRVGRNPGVLHTGTELVVGADGTIAGLLGASPGASTAVPIMLDLLRQCFPDRWHRDWQAQLTRAIPDVASAAGPSGSPR